MTTTEVAMMLRVHPSTIRNWEKAGILRSIRPAGTRGHRRYRRADIERLLQPVEVEQ